VLVVLFFSWDRVVFFTSFLNYVKKKRIIACYVVFFTNL